MEDWGFYNENEDQIANKKVWAWGIKRTKESNCEFYSRPFQKEFSAEQLRGFRFGTQPLIELTVMHNESILFLFNDNQSATTFMEGFKTGVSLGLDAEKFWQDKVNQWQEAKDGAPELVNVDYKIEDALEEK